MAIELDKILIGFTVRRSFTTELTIYYRDTELGI